MDNAANTEVLTSGQSHYRVTGIVAHTLCKRKTIYVLRSAGSLDKEATFGMPKRLLRAMRQRMTEVFNAGLKVRQIAPLPLRCRDGRKARPGFRCHVTIFMCRGVLKQKRSPKSRK
jgi:hypothetical protein